MKRYDIYFVRLDPTEGSEIAKTRPCVIVSLDVLNAILPTVVVCPLTSRVRPEWRTRIQITCQGRAADICVEQIRVVSKDRLLKKVDALKKTEAEALRRLIVEMYGSA